ncbi:MAG TPA: VOC family protein, partial [Acidimicrobiales bacterium]|nr:VOC family protein [Acidimicrobiales bacterium]
LREALERITEAGVEVVGASDHTVTHSLYILDPDGNEVELYIDVQPEIWHDDPTAIFSPIKPLVL